MQIKKEVKKREKVLAISQIIILVLGTIAIAYAIGSSIMEVSAAGSYGQTFSFPTEQADTTKKNKGGIPTNLPYLTFADKNFLDKLKGTLQPIRITQPLPESKKATDTTVAKTPTTEEGVTWKNAGDFALELAKDAGIAFVIYQTAGWISSVFKKGDTKYAVSQAIKSIAVGYAVGSELYNILNVLKTDLPLTKGGFHTMVLLGNAAPWISLGIGVVVAYWYFVHNFKKESTQVIHFSCDVWNAPAKGNDCDKCNKQGIIPCTEYQCKSLGQACEIVNQKPEEQCVWKSRNDITPPIVQPWEGILLDGFVYKPDGTVAPPDRGVFVKYKEGDGGCIPAFTPFTFGVTTNELTICKWDSERKTNFNEMLDFMGSSSTLKYNHSMMISLPSPESLEGENITLENGGNFEVHVRCVDANENSIPSSPSASFVFKYCVDEGPDTTPPKILGTSPFSNTAIAYNQTSIDMELYVNEPAECKWTHDTDKAFSVMEGTMQCSNNIFEMNAQMLYICTTTLTGLKSKEDNQFYFRCKDKPLSTQDRYENQEGYSFIIRGTEPLVIEKYGPNETISGASEIVEITLMAETAAGANDGEATCYYSNSCYTLNGNKNSFTSFFYANGTTSYIHEQDNIWVKKGNYDCVIKCNDPGGNLDQKEFSFKVEIDTSIPEVIRAYQEGNYLKIITSEEAICVYSTQDCNYQFKDGVTMDTINGLEHFTNWDTEKTFYIRCEDEYKNSPNYGVCSIIVRPIVISS